MQDHTTLTKKDANFFFQLGKMTSFFFTMDLPWEMVFL